jgi:hypothetical protein
MLPKCCSLPVSTSRLREVRKEEGSEMEMDAKFEWKLRQRIALPSLASVYYIRNDAFVLALKVGAQDVRSTPYRTDSGTDPK